MKSKEEDVAPSASELLRQKELQARLERPRFEFLPIARFLCKTHNVRDVTQIVPFGSRVSAWQLMKQVTLGIEVGSVVKDPNEPPHIFQFNLEPEDSGESQAVRCFFDPSLPWCRFLGSPQPVEPFRNPVTGVAMPADLDRVCAYNIVCRSVWSSVPINIAGRLNFYHKGINELQQSEQQDSLFAAAGGVKGAFISIAATKKEGEDIEVVPMPALGFSCVNDFFTATMALINSRNIMNGIIEIPNDVCIEAGLPVFRGAPEPGESFLVGALEAMTLDKDGHETKILSEEEKQQARARLTDQFKNKWQEQVADAQKIHTFFAVPINHVYAWPLQSEDYATQHGFRSEQFRFLPPPNEQGVAQEPIVLYYLVADVYFRAIQAEFEKVWMGKTDMRPLSSMAFEFVPQLDRARYKIPHDIKTVQGVMSLRSYITFMAPPKLSQQTIDSLAPTLALNFPTAENWSMDDIAKQMAMERFAEAKAVSGKKKE